MRNRLSNQIKDLSIDKNEEAVIIGCLLGDATLSKSGKFYRLRIEQKSAHKEYVEWKFNWLKRLCITPPQFSPGNNSYRFGTVGHPELSKLHSEFYGENRSINPFVLNKVNDLSIAIWFMDDGYKIHSTVGISANNFSEAALKQLQSLFKKLGIATSLQKDKRGKRIYIKSSSYQSFKKLVKPYISQVKCMAYKLPNPVE
ncbi:MAG: LAGLIDADG family homing endonuclease, partial [Candidatus Kryptoniota bacterium]